LNYFSARHIPASTLHNHKAFSPMPSFPESSSAPLLGLSHKTF